MSIFEEYSRNELKRQSYRQSLIMENEIISGEETYEYQNKNIEELEEDKERLLKGEEK